MTDSAGARVTDSARGRPDRVTDLHTLVEAAGASAVGAAEEPTVDLDAVPDDLDLAMLTDRREPVNGALERVENVDVAGHMDLERHSVVVVAYLANRHTYEPAPCGRRRQPEGREPSVDRLVI
jgi:hypothetical protein